MADDRRLHLFLWSWGATVVTLVVAPADWWPVWLDGEPGAILGLGLLGALWWGAGVGLRLADRRRSHRRARVRD